ncbi:hypothetical protein [Flavobacterium sp. FlaQc-47]|jgi:hypothetical protein|uniref:hypothetical protein n=1 Tax=Flavobacterium sp. FlaQc-47 TaxID=3374180 RepID=UPI0037580444
MTKKLSVLFFLLTIAGYSQQLTYKSGGTVYNSDDKKIPSNEVRQLLANNPEALALYNSGRSKKTFGNVFLYGGIGLVATNLIIGLTTDNTTYSGNSYYPSAQSEKTNMTAAIIGGVLIIASIPIKIGYSKKVKSAIEKYNAGLADTYKPAPKTTLIASSNQIGVRIEF